MAPLKAGTCASCGRTATLRCSKCSEGVNADGDLTPTYYCGAACQKSDYKRHKLLCPQANARKQLYRAGELLQRTWYTFARATYAGSFVDAKYRGDKILIRLPFIAERTGSFYPFPDHLVFQEKDRMSLLSHQGCRVALAYMHHLASKSVDGILLKSGAQEEWSVRFLECENRIVEIMADGTQNNRVCDHAVMVLTLVDGERYVVDLAGAQYGQYRAVRHLPAYTRDYAHRVVSKNVVGYEDQYHEDQLAGKRIANMPKAYDWCIPMKRKNVTLWLNHKIDAWEDEQHIFVSDMENLKQTDFDVRQEEFLEYYSNQVRELEQGEAALSERDERDGGDEEEREMRALETLPEHMKQSILARKSLKTMSLRARDEFAAKKAGRSEVP